MFIFGKISVPLRASNYFSFKSNCILNDKNEYETLLFHMLKLEQMFIPPYSKSCSIIFYLNKSPQQFKEYIKRINYKIHDYQRN